MKKEFFRVFKVVLSVCLLFTCLVSCGSPNTAKAEEYSYVSMRINPEIEMVIDGKGSVVAVNAVNEDGETVLCKVELTGKSVEEAAKMFTAMATELGFIDVNTVNATVYISIDGQNQEFIQEKQKKIKDKVNEYFDGKGIFGKVEQETLEEFKAFAEELNVSLKEAKIIDRISNLYPEMTLEEILELSFKEKLELIKKDEKLNGFTAKVREEYNKAVELLKEEYADLFEKGKKIDELLLQLKDQTLTEEEIAQINAQLEELKSEYETLKKQYKEEINKLKDQSKEDIEQAKQTIKQKAEERHQQFKDELLEHQQKFEEKRKEIEDLIKAWREAFDF